MPDATPGQVELPATLSVFGAPPAPATVIVRRLSGEARLGRAAARLGLCWGLAVVAVFIPVAHFVLVPSMVAAGIVTGVVAFRQRDRLLQVAGACPRCGVRQRFAPGGAFHPGRTFDCPRCRHALTVAPAPPA